MNLLDEAMTMCVRLVPSDEQLTDHMGGAQTRWAEGGTFFAAITPAREGETRLAERDQADDRFAVIVGRAVTLHYHDAFRRLSDGAVFRVVGDGAEARTPASAGLDMRRLTAERWVLPA